MNKPTPSIFDTYPMNLAVDIFGDEEEAIKIYLPGIETAIATLTEREQKVLNNRYKEHQSLEECGKIHGVTRERIRQIEVKALRKLRHPSKSVCFKAVPRTELIELNDILYHANEKYKLLLKAYEHVTQNKTEVSIEKTAEDATIKAIPLIDLGLSVRTYNCLSRAGVKTLGDIASMTLEELMRVRNLGRKSLNETEECLKKHGLLLAVDKTVRTMQYAESEAKND